MLGTRTLSRVGNGNTFVPNPDLSSTRYGTYHTWYVPGLSPAGDGATIGVYGSLDGSTYRLLFSDVFTTTPSFLSAVHEDQRIYPFVRIVVTAAEAADVTGVTFGE